jgi:type IV pilus assembly protein PilC
MVNYIYKARDASGAIVNGAQLAENEIDLANKLSKFGYILTQIKEAGQADGKESVAAGTRIKLNQKEVLNFTVSLSTLIKAGLPLIEGLQGLSKDAEGVRIREMVNDLSRRIESGNTLRDALAAHPETFPPLYISIVGVGEATGSLGVMLNDIAEILEWQLDLMSKVKEVASYPIILFTVMIGVIGLLVIKVIPVFAEMFSSAGGTLPLPTQIVLSASALATKFWFLPPVIIIPAISIINFIYRSEKGARILDTLKLKIPLFGTLIHKIALTRFSHTLSLSLKGGINILEALKLSRNVVRNHRISEAIKNVEDSIKIGKSLSDALSETKLFPPLVLRMVGVGERSGSLVACLQKVNVYYDKEIPATIRTIFALFEPIMLLFMGVVIGGIALALFLPLFQMATLVGG